VFYRYVRNPIYAGFVAVLIGEVLVTGSPGLLEYTAVAWCIGAAAVRFYEEPTLARKCGATYQAYRRAVPGSRLHPGRPGPDRPPTSAGRRPPAAGRRSQHAPHQWSPVRILIDQRVPCLQGPVSLRGPFVPVVLHQRAPRMIAL
jgi:hypothetical protein